MKQILAIITVLLSTAFAAQAQYNNCAPSVSVLTFYYSAEQNTKYGLGIETGIQGLDSRLGYFVGAQFQEMSDDFILKDSSNFTFRASIYLKGTYRLNEDPVGKGSIFLVASSGLSVQTGFDIKPGLRFVLPFNEKNAIGLEPSYSINYKTASLNVLVIF